MKSKFKKCSNCSTYTFREICPKCGSEAINPLPPRFSLKDPYSKYRRLALKQK
ncbi:MAG: RNA-protein complex protein Nop10 [Methanocellales archaeon]